MSQLKDALEIRLAEHDSFLRQGASASAFVRLGEVLNVVSNSELPNGVRYNLLGRVEEAARSIGQAAVHADFEADLRRLRKVTSVGSDFNDDEILLVLTLRVQLQMAVELYAQLGWDPAALSEPEIDATIREIIRTNEKSAQIALGLARKNWGVPLVTDWL